MQLKRNNLFLCKSIYLFNENILLWRQLLQFFKQTLQVYSSFLIIICFVVAKAVGKRCDYVIGKNVQKAEI